MMHQPIGKINKIIIYLIILLLSSTLTNLSFTKSNFFKINSNQIKISGLSEKKNKHILSKFDKINKKNIFLLRDSFFLKIFNEINLIHSFNVKKIYPNLIEIELKKTKFLAITNYENKKYFIGSNYKLVDFEIIDKDLPYVFGRIEIDKFISFKKKIDESYFSYKDISEIYFFPSGRWDIKNKDNIIIKLPEKDLVNILNLAYKIINDKKFTNYRVIDLRSTNQLITYNE